MTDKVFDYLQTQEDELFQQYKNEKQNLDNYIKNKEWDRAIRSVIRLKIYHAELNMISSMVEAHECGDI